MAQRRFDAVKNPLAVIAIFAGISEVAMAVTLLKLPLELQKTFVWFVMVFPVLLVCGFFFVLYKRPAVLFSPSDYKDDQRYLDSIATEFSTTRDPARFQEISKSIEVLEHSIKELAETSGQGDTIQASIASGKSRAKELLELRRNDLFVFLVDTVGIDEQRALALVREATDVTALLNLVDAESGSPLVTEQFRDVIASFPRIESDFARLKVRLGDT